VTAVRDETSIRAWRPRVPGIREVLHARFTDHSYPLHTHDTWTLFLVDHGAIRYDIERRARGAAGAEVWILPPYVVHDGRPATGAGFRKRVLYVELSTLGEELIGPSVDRPVVGGPRLRAAVSAVHETLARADDLLEAETRFAFVIERVRMALTRSATRVAGDDVPADDLAEALRTYLDLHLFEPVTMAEASAVLAASPTRLARSFATVFGIPPHRYVLGRRMDAARRQILAGQPLADVAAEVGFVDQAHLTRHFRRFLGVTPGRFARS